MYKNKYSVELNKKDLDGRTQVSVEFNEFTKEGARISFNEDAGNILLTAWTKGRYISLRIENGQIISLENQEN